jgi:hypothetical protein
MAQTDGVAGVVLTTPPHTALVAPAITPDRADLPIARLMAGKGPRTAVERLHGGLAGRATCLGLSPAMQTGVESLATVQTAVESWAPGLARQAASMMLSSPQVAPSSSAAAAIASYQGMPAAALQSRLAAERATELATARGATALVTTDSSLITLAPRSVW